MRDVGFENTQVKILQKFATLSGAGHQITLTEVLATVRLRCVAGLTFAVDSLCGDDD